MGLYLWRSKRCSQTLFITSEVRAGNGCKPGEWSNQLSAKTGQRFPTYRWSSLPQIVATGVTQRINPASITTIEADAFTVTPSPTPSASSTQQQGPTPTSTTKTYPGTDTPSTDTITTNAPERGTDNGG